MARKGFWIATLGILFGFLGGFFLANMMNRKEIDALKLRVSQAEQSQQKMELGDGEAPQNELSPDEIKAKIKQADDNPQNYQYQKDLGQALYIYARMQKNPEMVNDAKRLMLRALEKFPTDYDLLVGLGTVSFDIGQRDKDNKSIEEARSYYAKALAQKPDKVDLQTDIGSTYFLTDPPQYDKAIIEYRKALQIDPQHLRTMDNLTRTLIMNGQFPEAEAAMGNLKKINATYSGIADLEKLMADKKQMR